MARKQKKQKEDFSKAELEKIGKTIISVSEYGYSDKKRLFSVSFVKGVLTGLGGVIGATLGVAILIYLLSLFDSIPLIGNFVDSIVKTIDGS